MSITKDKKAELITGFKHHAKDTGSPAVQIALCTERINSLTGHFKKHKKDHHSRMGLLRLVSQRRRLLDYLKRKNADEYKALLSKLDLRK
ncbi:MAG: 30S ribosomal protein S15 [Candidatus Omnitrophica bacterium]|nr:30S ribosomal protein S15 [Candidatus Omnitrophota bacterium]